MGRTLRVTLPDELEREVEAAVARGEYASEGEAICGAVAEWQGRRATQTLNVDELRALWQEGIESGQGRSMSIEEIKTEARRRWTSDQ